MNPVETIPSLGEGEERRKVEKVNSIIIYLLYH
jgi:hypothetical protein